MNTWSRAGVDLTVQFPATWVVEEEPGWINLFPTPRKKEFVMIRLPRTVEGARADAARECALRIGKAGSVTGDSTRASAHDRDRNGILWVVAKGKAVVEAWIMHPEEPGPEARGIIESITL